ncbi:MAG: HD domain-containing protein [Magnetococcales bacterium]|nr:HD domain-containing protein [Magnetococcales bacterium]MBF0438318.1 HD domain-containing protein [Magnetococcales bacterium]
MTRKVFRDAVHNMISLHRERDGPASAPADWGDALVLELIDVPEMQRLRRIRQLGPAARIYPSAEHSRFSHALGVMHLAKRILANLEGHSDTQAPPLLQRAEMLQVKVAALFHDIGHGPYSHVFDYLHPGLESHEARGWRIVTHSDSIRAVIRRHCDRLGLDEARFIHGLGAVWGLAGMREPPRFGRQVISSQLDADRMDYLLRDAHFTGVSYGRYDLEWLLHSLQVREMDGVVRLCVDLSKGPAALESYVAARDDMYRQVYDHKTVRAFEALLIHLFGLLGWLWRLEKGPPPGTPPVLVRFLESMSLALEPALADFLRLDDTVVDYAIGHWAEMDPVTPAQAELRWKCRMFRDRVPIYRRIVWHLPSEEESGRRIKTEIIHDEAIAEAIEQFFQQHGDTLLTVRDGDSGWMREVPLRLLVQVDRLDRAPYAHLQYAAGRSDPVYVIDGMGHVLPAEAVSTRIHFLGVSRRRLVRVFVDPRVKGQVMALLQGEFRQWM